MRCVSRPRHALYKRKKIRILHGAKQLTELTRRLICFNVDYKPKEVSFKYQLTVFIPLNIRTH